MVATCFPQGRGHIICDNLFAHNTDDVQDWFDDNPRWKQHFTPKHASWLNQVECWFSILSRQALKHSSFRSPRAVRDHIDAFIQAYNHHATPFRWRAAEVHPSAPKRSIANLLK